MKTRPILEITLQEKRVILHCLGLTPRGQRMPRWSYRNYYCLDRLGDDAFLFRKAARKGIVKLYFKDRCYAWYQATKRGIAAAGVENRVRREDLPR